MHHVIIGNSAAGVRAAETLRLLDQTADITMVADVDRPAYSRCLLPEFLAGKRGEDDLRLRPPDFYDTNNIQTRWGKAAVAIDPVHGRVALDDGSELPFHRLLLATGASSVMPPVPGINHDFVFGLRRLADAQGILRACLSARRVVVVGGGFVGLEAGYALNRRGLEVTVVEKLPHILPLQMDPVAAGILMRDMETAGIKFCMGSGVREITGPGKDRGVALENGEWLEADLVIVATGIRPNAGLAREAGITVRRGVPVNEYLETNRPGIYAAGDVAETRDLVTGEIGLTPIWPNASTQGRVAACNMAGFPRVYGGLIGMQNAVEFREVPAIAMGIIHPTAGYEELVEYRPRERRYRKLVLRDEVLVGMILVGDISQAGVYAALIKKQACTRGFRGVLMRDDFSYAYFLDHSGSGDPGNYLQGPRA